jgi:hypothetical protein
MLQNVIPRTYPGNVGDTVKWKNGYSYTKSKNGKWALIIPDRLKKKVVRLYKNQTFRDISEEVGLSMSTVQAIVNEEGVSKGKADLIKHHKQIVQKNRQKIIRMYVKDSASIQEITECVALRDPLHVKNVLQEEGIALRSTSERVNLAFQRSLELGTANCVKRNQESLRNAFRKTFTTQSSYKYAVRKVTESVLVVWGDLIDTKSLRSYDHHVDHQLSLFDGWNIYSQAKNRYVKRSPIVPLHIICHPANLKLMPCTTNMKKNSTSHLSLEELLLKIKHFEKKHGKVFIQ